MSLPLAGIRILDLSNVLAGPFCGYNLARMGAEVIKVENPQGGDLARRLGADPEMARRGQGLSFVAVNAGKGSIALDFKKPAGRAAFLKLVESAHVVLENFRPGVMQRLGLGYEALKAHNPGLIYCAISGFGQNGPWAGRPAYDQIIQGLSGAMSVTGDAATAPLRTGFPISDTIAGMTAAFAISAALVEQQRTGAGRFIDVSLLESTLAAMGWVVSNHLNADVVPVPMGNENFTAAPSGTFRTGSGPLNIAANEQKQFEALCDAIGRPDLKTDPRFAERQARKQNRFALNAAIEAGLASRSATEWETILNDLGVPSGCVLTVPETLAETHLGERAFVETLNAKRGDGGPLKVTRPGFVLGDGFEPPTPPPGLGVDTRRLLAEAGYTPAEIDAMLAEGSAAGE